MADRELTRAELAKLTPSMYLKSGYVGLDGRPYRELFSTFATAACIQLQNAEVSPQELNGTWEALRQVFPWHKEPDAKERLQNAIDEALDVTSAMYNQPNNPGIVKWLESCAAFVKSPQDVEAFARHFLAVVRQYNVIAGAQSR